MAVQIDRGRSFLLQTADTSYAVTLDRDGVLCCVHWGGRIDRIEDLAALKGTGDVRPDRKREECSSFGGLRVKETSLKAAFPDGTRDFRYVFRGYRLEAPDHLVLVLEDAEYPLRVSLHYRVYEEDNIIEKWREAENLGQDDILLERFYSAEFGLPGRGYQSLNFHGRWGAEFRMVNEPIDCGRKVYESLCGLTAHGSAPAFVVHRNADEDHGEVFYGVLRYSGNFKVSLEAAAFEYLNVLIGINDTDFCWRLKAGERFSAPAVCAGYSKNGFTAMSHTLHTFAARRLMPPQTAGGTLPILYNSWYATTFHVNCAGQILLAEEAAKIGAELFVMDDGWFQGRLDDSAGLGDWYVDLTKFPDGLHPLIQRVHELGMGFGIWIEPEMVNPDSDLYRAHPDWILRYPNREPLTSRHQCMLDLSNEEAVDELTNRIDRLLTENDIQYIKWDMNRYAAEMGSPAHCPESWKELWHRCTLGFTGMVRELRARHPHVEFEACASGGGRVDFGCMPLFDEFWTSDNTDPLDRLLIQEGYSFLYPIRYMRAWTTEDPGMDGREIPLRFAAHSAICGAMGIGNDLSRMPEGQKQELAGYVADYKIVRETVQLGKVYRLCSMRDGDVQAVQYVKDRQSALFVFLDHQRYNTPEHRVRLKGLRPNAVYHFSLDGEEMRVSGSGLMEIGIEFKLRGDYDSRLLILTEEA